MSGFSSLLDQFKQTTQQAAAVSSSSSSRGASASSAGDTTNKKRPRSIFEAGNSKNSGNGGSRRGDHLEQHNESRHKHQQYLHQRYSHPTTPVRTIYIACPAFAETGGPEALHQLCHVINTGGYACDDGNGGDGGDDNTGATEKYDEFGRSISNHKKDASADGEGGGAGSKKENAVRAYMLYLRERGSGVEHIQSSRARSSKYDRYDAPPAITLPGVMEFSYGVVSKDNSNEYSSELVIWPECWTHLIDSLQPTSHSHGDNCKKYQIAIWWLSVNNNKGRFLPDQFGIRKDILHLVQSAYARDYVSSKLKKQDTGKGVEGISGGGDGLNVMNLTEFIPYASPSFATQQQSEDEAPTERDLDVVYNTAKGMHYTDEIIRRACGKKFKTNMDGSVSGGGIRFNPIGKGAGGRERMTGGEVVALLKRSKVYIDFGPHPGMDRLPREAALAGCIVLTNCEGAANFNEDVPLPTEFKFQSFDVNKVYALLKECCGSKHQEYVGKMEPYREWILGQEKQMEVCVGRLVDRLVTRRIAKNIAQG